MAADNGLYQNAEEDINELESAAIPDFLNIIVQLDSHQLSDIPNPRRYLIKQDDDPNTITSPVLETMEEINSGDWHELRNFIDYGINEFDSERYILNIWSHGNGWRDKDYKWICSDAESNEAIDVYNGELRKALRNHNKKIDITIFDACNMQNIEVITEIVNSTDYIIGSESLVPSDGFPYNDIIMDWTVDLSQQELSALWVNKYISSYKKWGSQNQSNQDYKVTCSAFKTSEYSSFYNLLDNLIHNWRFEASKDYFQEIRNNLHNFNLAEMDVDLKQFFTELKNISTNDSIKVLSDSLLHSIDSAFVAQDFSGFENNPEIGTATIWYPTYYQSFINLFPLYDSLIFNDIKWTAFLNQTFGADTTPPLPPHSIDIDLVLRTLYLSWSAPSDPSFITYKIQLNSGENSLDFLTTDTLLIIEDVDPNFQININSIDDNSNYSETISKNYQFNIEDAQFFVNPNPISRIEDIEIRWYFSKIKENANLKIFNIHGDQLLNKSFQVHTKEFKYTFSDNPAFFSDLSTGIYFCLLISDKKFYKTKFAITN